MMKNMQAPLHFKSTICELILSKRLISSLNSGTNIRGPKQNISNRSIKHVFQQHLNSRRNVHISSVQLRKYAGPFKKNNLVEKFMKDQKKKEQTKVYDVWPQITVTQLADVLSITAEDAFDLILSSGYGDSVQDHNSPITNPYIFKRFREQFRCKIRMAAISVAEEVENKDVQKSPVNFADLVPRPPIVALVGHIDHGKTTLLDRLRSSSVVATECGGITQHMGTFSLNLGENQKMTFLDTPGHAAFKAMRIRGTNITDIVILVVDAVEGPLEQTLESLRAIRHSQCSMIVAINKIDRPEANIERTKEALQEQGVQFEDVGGNVQCVPISALHGTNIDELIETVIVQAEVLQLSGDPKGPVEGTIVESSVEHGLGGTATILVKRGSLKKGAYLVCGTSYAKVKVLLDTSAAFEKQGSRKEIKVAGPADGCKVIGWKELPQVGAEVLEVDSERRAKEVVQWRLNQQEGQKKELDKEQIAKKREIHRQEYVEYRMKKLEKGFFKPRYGWHDFHTREKKVVVDDDQRPRVNILIRCDFDGSKDAILSCLDSYDEAEVRLDVLEADVGEATQEDVQFAHDFQGIIYCFNVGVSDVVRKTASHLNVPIREYNIIYRLIDDIKQEISLNMPMADVDMQVGKGFVIQEFLINEGKKKVPIAGNKVVQGKFDRNSLIKVIRGGNNVIRDVKLTSLKYKKDEASLINQGQECGLRLQDESVRFEPNDEIIFYEKKKVARKLEWNPGF